MTRQEAIQHFKEQLDIFGGEHAEAIKVAIEALKQVTGKLNNPDDSLLTADSEACKEQKSKLDLISRAEAIEAVCDGCVWYKTASCEEGKEEWECSEVNKIRHLPSADRPRGEWEEMGENKDGTHNIRCDQCGESFKARGHANSHNTKKKYRFCPSCGADMRGDQNE